MMTKIKICGIKTVTDALAAMEAGADLIGFKFLIFQDMVNRLERVFAGDATRARTVPPPASNDSMAWTKKEPDEKNRRCRQHHEGTGWQISTNKGKERPG